MAYVRDSENFEQTLKRYQGLECIDFGSLIPSYSGGMFYPMGITIEGPEMKLPQYSLGESSESEDSEGGETNIKFEELDSSENLPLKKMDFDTSSLAQTAEHGSVEQLEELLNSSTIDVNKRDSDGATAIFHASFGKKIKNIKLLITYGARTNLKDSEGNSFYNYGDWTPEQRQEIKEHIEFSKHRKIKPAKR